MIAVKQLIYFLLPQDEQKEEEKKCSEEHENLMRNIEDLKLAFRYSVKQFTETQQDIKVSVDKLDTS